MLYNMLYSTFLVTQGIISQKTKIYITRNMYPSETQTRCWDVIYNMSLRLYNLLYIMQSAT